MNSIGITKDDCKKLSNVLKNWKNVGRNIIIVIIIILGPKTLFGLRIFAQLSS